MSNIVNIYASGAVDVSWSPSEIATDETQPYRVWIYAVALVLGSNASSNADVSVYLVEGINEIFLGSTRIESNNYRSELRFGTPTAQVR